MAGTETEFRSLPSPEEREWLADQLAALIAACGWQRFLASPILDATTDFFPDVDPGEPEGAYWLARSLMAYAGLEKLQLELLIDEIELDPADRAVASFLGIESDLVRISLRKALLEETDDLFGALAHEVAQAFRATQELPAAGRDEEEMLTDLTEVYLGFGLLAANSSYRYHVPGYDAHGHLNPSQLLVAPSQRKTDFLPPQAFAYLLGLQALTRGQGSAALEELGALLEHDQRRFFHATLGEHAGREKELRRRLGLPDPREVSLPEELREKAPPPAGEPRILVLRDEGETGGTSVFRVRGNHGSRFFLVLTAISVVFVAAGALTGNLESFRAFYFAALPIAYFLGRSFRFDRCSRPSCKTILPANEQRCPGCGGEVRGRIRRQKDHLAAQEALARGFRVDESLDFEVLEEPEPETEGPQVPDWRDLGLEEGAIRQVEEIRRRDDHLVLRVHCEQRSYVAKSYAEKSDPLEIQAYALFESLGIPTLPIHGRSYNALLLEDLASSGTWRLAEESDQDSRELGAAVGDWYRQLHEAGRRIDRSPELLPAFLSPWVDQLEPGDLATAGEALGIDREGAWLYALDNLDLLLTAYRDLPRTLNYDDFALENLAVSRAEPLRALVFDYGQLCLGTVASDWRNVVSGLQGEARRGFVERYGRPEERERVLDDPLSILYALLVASRRDRVPAWAGSILDMVRDGRLESRIRAALEIALE